VRSIVGSVVIGVLVGVSGCHTASVDDPLTVQTGGNDVDAQMEFWHRLPEQRVASNDDAMHALLLFVDGSDPAADYDARVETLKQRNMLPADFNGTPKQAVKRGTVAVALARALQIKGGLTMRLFGPSPRYAVRELQYMNLFPPSSPQQTFSGQELLGIIGRAEDYQRQFDENALDVKPSTNPTAPPRGPAETQANDTTEATPGSSPQQP
jgi:hypothetical protein